MLKSKEPWLILSQVWTFKGICDILGCFLGFICQLTAHESPLVLFDVSAADTENLVDKQEKNPRTYLLYGWNPYSSSEYLLLLQIQLLQNNNKTNRKEKISTVLGKKRFCSRKQLLVLLMIPGMCFIQFYIWDYLTGCLWAV